MNQLTEEITLRGRKVVKGKAAGYAVVSTEPISFNGGVDPATGIVTEEEHPIKGVSVAGKVFVFPTGKGSTGGSNRIHDMADRKTAPIAFVQIRAEPITTIGAIMAGIPVVDRLDQDPTRVIETGDYVEVDADNGMVRVVKVKKGLG